MVLSLVHCYKILGHVVRLVAVDVVDVILGVGEDAGVPRHHAMLKDVAGLARQRVRWSPYCDVARRQESPASALDVWASRHHRIAVQAKAASMSPAEALTVSSLLALVNGADR